MRFNTAATCLAVTCLSVRIGENASLVVAAEGSDHHGHMADDHAWMDESDAGIVAYCARPCVGVGVGAGASITDVDPCGDGMGQSGFCTPISGLKDPTAFGYAGSDGDGAAVPDAFLGCSHAICAASCGDMTIRRLSVLSSSVTLTQSHLARLRCCSVQFCLLSCSGPAFGVQSFLRKQIEQTIEPRP